ncbi:MAG: hypothetical protein SFV32_04185 [Opitutaceae bacterium]|nr:hypothetical protein [Opitutaceae bacterium]
MKVRYEESLRPAGLWVEDIRGRASAELGRRAVAAILELLGERVKQALATAGVR